MGGGGRTCARVRRVLLHLRPGWGPIRSATSIGAAQIHLSVMSLANNRNSSGVNKRAVSNLKDTTDVDDSEDASLRLAVCGANDEVAPQLSATSSSHKTTLSGIAPTLSRGTREGRTCACWCVTLGLCDRKYCYSGGSSGNLPSWCARGVFYTHLRGSTRPRTSDPYVYSTQEGLTEDYMGYGQTECGVQASFQNTCASWP
ncbi:hypothetical protein C8Q72DRAFT_814977 [Fomitopsis betulina]|nr:hypothetical protein C8Q72DRAFT_814977 [Fomitopsis betulina]